MTTSSNTVMMDKEGSVVDWIEATSTLETPRQEAKKDEAESTSAAPTTISLTEKEEGVQIPTSTKTMMKIVPQSPVEELNTIKEADARPISPLEISGELKEEKKAESVSPSAEIVAAEELRIEGIETDVTRKGVAIPGSINNIPEDQNSDKKTSTLDMLPTGGKEEIGTAQLFPLPVGATSFTSNTVAETLPIDSTISSSDIIQKNESMHPVAAQAEKKNSATKETKIVDVLGKSDSKLPVDIPDKIKQDETVLDETTTTANPNPLKGKKGDLMSEEPSTISQPIAVEESNPSNALQLTKTEGVEEEKEDARTILPAEISISSSSQKEQHTSDHKNLSDPALTDATQPPSQSKEDKHREEKTTIDSQTVTEEATLPKSPNTTSNPEKQRGLEEKKGLRLFTKLKRKMSTKNFKDFKEDAPPPTPTTAMSFLSSPTTITSSPNSSIDGSKHIELVSSHLNSPTTACPREGKKSDGLFKTLRAVMSFSGRRSLKSPPAIKTGQTPVPSPVATRAVRARTWEKKSPSKPFSSTTTKIPIRPSTAKAVLKSSEEVPTFTNPMPKSPLSPTTAISTQFTFPQSQRSVRRLSPSSPVVQASLRQTQTWSPGAPTPVLASNPSAKLYTIWPRYPVVRAHTDEVQAVLEGFLVSDLKSIEKVCAPGRNGSGEEMINFWKAPLTVEQAEVVKAIQHVSSIQLSKLDYDPSDYFS